MAIIGKQKQIRLMFHLKFTFKDIIGKEKSWLSANLSDRKKSFTTFANC